MGKLKAISTAVTLALVGAGCNDPVSGYFAKLPAKERISDSGSNSSDGPSGPTTPGVQVPVTPPVPPTIESFALAGTTTTTVSRYKGVDLLWAVDNSGSMEPYQDRIAAGFKSFAQTYFVAGRDIRLAAITSDAYIAGDVDSPNKYGPGNSKCFSRLLPGVHDGVRPNVAPLNNDCSLNGPLPAGRTGRPIISTYAPSGALGDLAQLILDFQTNAKAGTAGDGDERILQSVSKVLKDNEERPECANGTGVDCLFRKNRVRGLILISDEHSHDVISYGGQSADATNGTIKNMTNNQVVANSAKVAGLFRSRFNDFFKGLDGTADPNYFVVSIANHTCSGNDCGLGNNGRDADEPWTPELTAMYDSVRVDTANSSGALSLKANIGDANYNQILNQIGTAIDTQTVPVVVTTFSLRVVPSGAQVKAYLVLTDGTRTQLPLSAVRTSGKNVEVERSALPATIPAGAQLEISYYP